MSSIYLSNGDNFRTFKGEGRLGGEAEKKFFTNGLIMKKASRTIKGITFASGAERFEKERF